MPFVLPRAASGPGRSAFILAFGKPSVLEVCGVMGREVSEVRTPQERVCTAALQPGSERSVPGLAGVLKFATVSEVGEGGEGTDGVVGRVIEGTDEVANVSLSAYGVDEAAYEELVAALLGSFRSRGLKKVHLIRPRGNELFADKIVRRGAIDFIVFPSGRGYSIGPVSFVAETEAIRARGVERPVPHSEISLSPRLAKLMVNLTGLRPGQTLLDPFCGSGTILAEGLLQRLRCVGVDSSSARVEAARRNLRWASSHRAFDVRLGDARELKRALGDAQVDGVATEPILLPELKENPRVEVAKGLMERASESYAEALASISESVRPGGRVVMVVPILRATDGTEVAMALDGRPLGLREFQPGHVRFDYPVRFSFESTRWIKRGLYVFELGG